MAIEIEKIIKRFENNEVLDCDDYDRIVDRIDLLKDREKRKVIIFDEICELLILEDIKEKIENSSDL